jgi:hypothetical protein
MEWDGLEAPLVQAILMLLRAFYKCEGLGPWEALSAASIEAFQHNNPVLNCLVKSDQSDMETWQLPFLELN